MLGPDIRVWLIQTEYHKYSDSENYTKRESGCLNILLASILAFRIGVSYTCHFLGAGFNQIFLAIGSGNNFFSRSLFCSEQRLWPVVVHPSRGFPLRRDYYTWKNALLSLPLIEEYVEVYAELFINTLLQ